MDFFLLLRFKDKATRRHTEKKNHFSDWLTHFQARETTNIPIDVIENIQKEINKYNYTEEEVKTISEVRIPDIEAALKAADAPYILGQGIE